ncbi:MAG: hypothetical protein CMA72_06015 [Euryarchaeota archaeon]|nr:hypothetical protein [Euryarchaeota archaeon]
MGGEQQLKALIRQTFALQNTADKAVLQSDQVLAQAMANVKRLVELLPEGSMLRNQAWKQLEPFVRQELEVYSNQLGNAIENALVDAEPGMERAALRQAQLAGADFGPETINLNPPGGGVQKSVELALNSRVNNVTVKRLFNLDGKGSGTPFDKALFKTVDTRVRAGMIQGMPTQEIANLMAQDVQRAGIPGVNLNAEAVKTIRSQSMAMARTATQDMARQVKDEVYDANADAMEGMEWQWTTALDSRTCETCAPMDGQRWKDKQEVPQWPLHPNCRCQALPIDPEDEFWSDKQITAQVIRPVEKGPYKGEGAYKTPVVINGKKFYRKAVTVTSDTPPPNYSDTLAYWAKNSQTSLNEAMGPSRAAWFTKEYDRLNRDPQQILQAMLTGKPGAQKWIPIQKLSKKSVTLNKPKSKAKPKAKFKAAPKPKPVAKAATPTQAAKPKFRTKEDNYDYDKNWEKLGYKNKAAYRKVKSDVVEWSGNDFEGVRAAQFDRAGKKGVQLNQYERLQTRRLESGEARSFGKMADRLEDFVERAPKYDGTLRRGVAVDKRQDVKDLIERYSKGDPNKAIESWTSDKRISDRFARGNNNPRSERITILVEGNTKGAPINAISGFDDEFEILVPSGVKYEVVEVQETFVKGSGKAGDFDREDHTDWVLKLREVID